MNERGRSGTVDQFQLFSLVVNVMVATGVFNIARVVGEKAGRGTPVAIILAGLLSLAQLSGMYLLSRRFPEQTLPEYAQSVLGKVPGALYLISYLILNLSLAVLIPRNFWILIDAWDLHTPHRVLLGLLVLLGWSMARRGVVVLSRVSQVLLVLSIPAFLLIIWPHSGLDFDRIRPVLDRGPGELLTGVLPAYFAMTGFDVFLFVYPFSRRRRTFGVASLAVGSATLLYAISSVLTITSLSLERTLMLVWPLQNYLNDFSFTVVDRLDVIFLMLWLWQVTMSVAIPLFMATSCLRGLSAKLSGKTAADICGALLFIAAMMPIDLPTQTRLLDLYSHTAIVFTGSFPLVLWLIAVLRRKGGVLHGKGNENIA